jgi:hypothetical protein
VKGVVLQTCPPIPFPYEYEYEGGIEVREGLRSSLKQLPSPLAKGRGIKGEGLLNNLLISRKGSRASGSDDIITRIRGNSRL